MKNQLSSLIGLSRLINLNDDFNRFVITIKPREPWRPCAFAVKTEGLIMNKEQYEYLATQIFQASLEVHKTLGPGLLESVYEFSLVKELQIRNIYVQYQVKIPLIYKGYDTGKEFFIDILVENEIVIEVKSCEEGMRPVHQAQLLSYLKLTDKRLGFLINFNVALLKDGFKRMVNNY